MNLASRLYNTAKVAVLARHERAVPFWSPERIARQQGRRVRAIAAHAYATVPFYMESMRTLRLTPRDIRSADDLALLPLIDNPLRCSRAQSLHIVQPQPHNFHFGDI